MTTICQTLLWPLSISNLHCDTCHRNCLLLAPFPRHPLYLFRGVSDLAAVAAVVCVDPYSFLVVLLHVLVLGGLAEFVASAVVIVLLVDFFCVREADVAAADVLKGSASAVALLAEAAL